MKNIAIDKLLSYIPMLSSVEAAVAEGELKGCRLRMDSNGNWSIDPASKGVDIQSFPKNDLVLASNMGQIVLEKPTATSCSGPRIKGVAISIHLCRFHSSSHPQRIYRTYVQVKEDLLSKVFFPGIIKDTSKCYSARALLPLYVWENEIDVFFIKEGPFLIIESMKGSLKLEKFQEIAGAIRSFLSYLLGIPLNSRSCTVTGDKKTGEVLDIWWHPGQASENHIYKPIPTSWSEWNSAKEELKEEFALPDISEKTLDSKVISRCIEKYLESSNLIIPIEYLIRFPDAPLEMRGASLSLALESLTAQIAKDDKIRTKKPLDDEMWNVLRDKIFETIDSLNLSWSNDQKDILLSKIENLNSSTNKEKLLHPFSVFQIPLSEDESKAIGYRNRLIHQGRIFDPGRSAQGPEAWKSVYLIEMRIYTSLNKLLLRYLGYSGAIIDWGKTPMDGSYQAYSWLPHYSAKKD